MQCVEMRNIRRVYPGVIANDDVNITIEKGEVLCLVGENGAGKSTLMKILYGLEQPDAGEIFLHGKAVSFRSSREAIAHKIGMVHQHFMLVDELSVLENIILGTEPLKGISLDYKKAREELTELGNKFNMAVPLDTLAGDLPVGVQQKVEILKAMYKGAEIIILDEPTAVLTPQETEELFETIRDLSSKGHTMILITHKLDEVMRVADKIVVMRRGKVVDNVSVEETNAQDLAVRMVGSELPEMLEKTPPGTEDILHMQGVTLRKNNNKPVLSNINLNIRAGEIVGIAGVSGNGQSELADMVAGLEFPSEGTVSFYGEDISKHDRRTRITEGISYIPEDRNATGLCTQWSIEQNIIAGYHRTADYVKKGFFDPQSIKSFCKQMIEAFDIRTPHGGVLSKALSGGNQQKIIIAREFSHGAKLVVAAEPTRGVDIGAISFIHNNIIQIKNKGVGVLLFSSDLDEIFKLSDRIAVLYEGEIVLVTDSASINREELGLYMAGIKKEVV